MQRVEIQNVLGYLSHQQLKKKGLRLASLQRDVEEERFGP
jgi:hypothetical protein